MKGSTLMTDDPLQSRPTADGEMREQFLQLGPCIGPYDEPHRCSSMHCDHCGLCDISEDVLHLIKQNTPSKESVSPPKHHTSKADDSSIPDDDPLQSQPQPDQEWLDDTFVQLDNWYRNVYRDTPTGDTELSASDAKAAIQSHIQQLHQAHEAEVLEAQLIELYMVNRRQPEAVRADYMNSRIDKLKARLAHLKQQQQERGTGGEGREK